MTNKRHLTDDATLLDFPFEEDLKRIGGGCTSDEYDRLREEGASVDPEVLRAQAGRRMAAPLKGLARNP